MKNVILFFALLMFSYSIKAQITFVADQNSGCDSLTVNFSNTSTATPELFYWSFGDGNELVSMDSVVTNTFYGPGVYEVYLLGIDTTGSNGNPDDYVITGYFVDEVYISGIYYLWSNSSELCTGEGTGFGFEGAVDSVLWDFQDGSYSDDNDPWHAFNTPGVYMVELMAFHACGVDTEYVMVEVSNAAIPDAGFWINQEELCPGEMTGFSPYINEWTWDFEWDFDNGNSSSNPNPVEVFQSAGEYVVTLTVTNQCGNQSTSSDTVYVSTNATVGEVSAEMIFNPSCPGDTVHFYAGGENTYDYVWEFGDGTSAVGNPVEHPYSVAGNYTVELTATNSCGNSETFYEEVLITSAGVPLLSDGIFGTPSENDYCPGDSVLFYVLGYDSVMWDFGDGTISYEAQYLEAEEGFPAFVVEHPYAIVGTYTATVTVWNGCGNSSTGEVTIEIGNNVFPSAYIETGDPENGSSFMTCEDVDFMSFSGSSYLWDFGDGSQLATTDWIVSHNYSEEGEYDVSLSITNGCGNSDMDFSTIWVENSASFNNNSGILTASEGDSYQWYIDGVEVLGASGQTYEAGITGSYSVEVIYSNGCSSFSDTAQITGTGIKEVGFNHDFLYPNPSTENVYISLLEGQEKAIISIFDLCGKVVMRSRTYNTNKIDLSPVTSKLNSGIYFVEVQTEAGKRTSKLVMQ